MELKIVLPILGFEEIKSAKLEKIDDFFYELNCAGIAFTLIDPVKLREYDFTISNSQKDALGIESSDEVKVYNIVTISNPLENSTINFLAPIIVNEKKALLAQIILDENRYKEYGLRESIKNFL
jgi:flagellar assembly factor FliW